MNRESGRPRWLYLIGAIVAVWMAAPPLVVIPMSLSDQRSFSFPPNGYSLRWYREFFENPMWLDALRSSISIAIQVMLLSVVLGTLASFAIVRGRFRGRNILEMIGIAPLIVPVVVLGIGTYAIFLKWGLVGTVTGFVAAHTVLAVPYVIITVSSSLRIMDRQLERAATVLGASPYRVFRRITLPIIAPGVLAGGLFAFVTSFDEVVVSLFIANPQLRTLPVEMYSSVTRDIDPTIAAASTLILIVSTVLILVSTKFLFSSKAEGRSKR
ncbi:MAG: putative spermidine/putrescine transport system permease protein [Actinomycetota bacterium]|nr:putative spermidine/putrescine transport system permease protein [Actinomycetota bacterium]MDQ1668056.1 putative spermidine/putrescine transport system permease protein [Actinomycetota bacterium]